ncbi:hypothetical protein GGD38_004129 [Chitinophagaceae bacterium OAS944]|nr:hypothetical protein [Chitinophagaceae bacterium OAS944]
MKIIKDVIAFAFNLLNIKTKLLKHKVNAPNLRGTISSISFLWILKTKNKLYQNAVFKRIFSNI